MEAGLWSDAYIRSDRAVSNENVFSPLPFDKLRAVP